MHVTLHMAVSLNGFIARDNDDTDFLSHDQWVIFVELAHSTGALIWGRKTHELVRAYGEQFLRDLDGLKRIVVSTTPHLALEAGWEIAASPHQALNILATAGVQRALLVGGATLNTAFARANLIDEVILNLESVIVGRGIPLFAPHEFDLPLQLVNLQQVRNNIIQLHYHVNKVG